MMKTIRIFIAAYPFFFGALAYLMLCEDMKVMAWVMVAFSMFFAVINIGLDKK